jgi:hypothetical protein
MLAVISLGIAGQLASFCWTQIRRVSRNRTTLEVLGRDPDYFDLGVTENLRQVFGSRWGIFCPLPNDEMSGFEWTLSEFLNGDSDPINP